jgi:regulator of protease activity HflC (stomatin/prohibitin superfamily)
LHAEAWGLEIKRYEITEISPDKFITEAMDKQAAAERERRKKVLEAEGIFSSRIIFFRVYEEYIILTSLYHIFAGDKRAAELESEGQKIRMINESEGNLIKVRYEN